MFFSSPIWLALLVPWFVVTVWLLWGRRQTAGVPFLDLWRSDEPSPRSRRWVQLPPLALVAALAAMLLAILAAGRPTISDAGMQGPLVTIIVDRGVTMSVGERLRHAIDEAREAASGFGPGPVDLVAVPDGAVQRTDRSEWVRHATSLPPTIADTRAAVRVAVRRALAANDALILVLSDQQIPPDPRVIQIAPATPLRNVAITFMAARQSPRPQVMVTVRNQSDLSEVTLLVRSGDQSRRQAIELPRERGEEWNYFVDLDDLGETIEAELRVEDDFALDNVAYLARESAVATIELRTPVPAEVRRVTEAYSRARPPQAGGRRVTVAASLDAVVPTEPAVIVASDSPSPDEGEIVVVDHPITAHVDWRSVRPEAVASSPPAGDWTPLVRRGEQVLVAVRRGETAGQVWVGFASRDFARTPDFVVFWTQALDFVAGGGAAVFTAFGPESLGEEWQLADGAERGGEVLPGIYRRSDGALRAVNLPPVEIAAPPAHSWRAKLAELPPRRRGGREVTSSTLLVALACLTIAACAWPRRRLTPLFPPRKV